MRPVLCRGHWPSQENVEKARGTSSFPPGLFLQGIKSLQACGDGVCQVTQASLEVSNKFSYSNNPAPVIHPGLFPPFQGVTPAPHFSTPTVPLAPAGIKAEHQIPPHTSQGRSSPPCLLAHWAGIISVRRQVLGSKPSVIMGVGYTRAAGAVLRAGTELPSAHRAPEPRSSGGVPVSLGTWKNGGGAGNGQ